VATVDMMISWSFLEVEESSVLARRCDDEVPDLEDFDDDEDPDDPDDDPDDPDDVSVCNAAQ